MIALPPATRAQVGAAMQAVVDHARDAQESDDLDAMKRQLAEVWHAVHHAHETISQAERDTRAAMVSRIEGKAA